MRILYLALQYEHGRRERGLSFEHYNFFAALVAMGHEVLYADLGLLRDDRAQPALSRRLVDLARAERPDLIDKVRYYLAHEDERAAIAEAGWRRTLAEHTYVHRFAAIFGRMGLPVGPLEPMLSGAAAPGPVREVLP